ncbi:MAG: hypothetical protein FJW90_08810 [Actinobacteria bacterium]|nr:hypothetical protein [Actinomycetota bacterium]
MQAARLQLVNDVNFILYTPFLPEAAAGLLEPRHVVTPLREVLERTCPRLGAVCGQDPAARRVTMRSHDGAEEELRYDQLVVSVGSVSRTRPVPGLDRHAIGFKSLADAISRYPRARLHGMRLDPGRGQRPRAARDRPAARRVRRARAAGTGIEVRLGTTLESVGPDSAALSTGESVPTRSVVWTAGVTPHPSLANLELPLDERGRVIVDERLAVRDRNGV